MVILGSDVDEGWAWIVLLASYFNLLICSGLSYVAGMFQLVFLEQFQGSVAFTSWITALFSSFMQLGGPLSSVVSNNFNCRTSVMAGGILMTVGLVVSSMANSLELLFVTFGLMAGAGIGLTYTSSIIILNYFFEERRTLITGVALSASGLGILISPQISRFLFDNFSWRETLVIMSAAAAQVCVTGAVMNSKHEMKRQRCCRLISWLVSCSPWCKNDRGNRTHHRGRDTDNDVMIQKNFYTTPTHPPKEGEESSRSDAHSLNMHEEIFPCRHCKSGKQCDEHYTENDDVLLTPVSHHTRPSEESRDPHLFTPQPQFRVSPTLQRDNNVSKVGKPDASPIPNPFVFGSQGNRVGSANRTNFSGSHEEILAERPLLRIKALKKSFESRSHQELYKSRSPSERPKTVSNPNLIRRLGDSRMSMGPSKPGCQVVVVSRNPSLLGLVPSTAPINVIVASTEELQSNPSLHSNSILENKLILTDLPPSLRDMKKASNTIISDLEPEDTESLSDPQVRQFPPLYRNKYFWVLCTSLFVENAGCGIFNIHFPSFVKAHGLSDQQLTNVLSVNGFAILFGRCLCGALANAERDSEMLIWWTLHVLGGLCVCMMPLVGQSYVGLIILVYGMGNYYGTVYAVLSSMTIQMVGLSSLATAFGVEMICAGLGYFVSPPIAGLVVDLTGDYDHSLYSAGVFYITGGMIIFAIPLLCPLHHQATPFGTTPDKIVESVLEKKDHDEISQCSRSLDK